MAGAIVTIDAMGGQKESAKTIPEPGAEYVLARKDNHPTRHADGQLWCEDVTAERLDDIPSACQTPIDAEHGRLETRHSWSTSDSEC